MSSLLDDISIIIINHINRYPLMGIQDLYKLIHQAALGAEHAVENYEKVYFNLIQELEELKAGFDEPMIDPISPDGKIVRLHLRPFFAKGGDMAQLSHSFFASAHAFHGNISTLSAYWQVAMGLTKAQRTPFKSDELDAYFNDREEKKFQAVHHTRSYRDAYHPAYRVMLRELINFTDTD